MEKEKIARSYLNLCEPEKNSVATIQARKIHYKYDIVVIIPCYNAENYVEQCIKSVLYQKTNAVIYIKLIDDGSTDHTFDIMEKFKNVKNIEIIHQKNTGFSSARNRGLEKLESRYLFFLDSDDYLPEDALENLYIKMEQEQADIIEGKMITLYNDQYNEDSVLSNNMLSGYVCGKLIRTELFQQICFPDDYWFEDSIMSYLIYPRCLKKNKINVPVYVYRRNPESITFKSISNPKSIDTYWITELMLKEMKKLNIPINQEIFEQLTDQIILNFIRTNELDTNTKVAIFYLTKSWFVELSNKYMITDKFKKMVIRALKANDYSTYEQACILAWNHKLYQLD